MEATNNSSPHAVSSYHLKSSSHLLPIVLIIILSIGLYANTLQNGFVYDDEVIIVNNILIKDLGNVTKLFNKEEYFTLSGEGSYRPFVTLTHFIDFAIFGLDSWGHHLTNTLLHAINGVLLYILLALIIQPSSIKGSQAAALRLFLNPPLLMTLLFITHPVLTEGVNAVSLRADLLVFHFYILTLTMYIALRRNRWQTGSHWLIYILSCTAYFLALLSKEMAITLPLIIYCYEWIYADKKKAGIISALFNRYNIGYIALASVYIYIRFYYFINPVIKRELPPWGLTERLLAIPWLILSYIKLCLFPVSLSADYAAGAIAHYASGAIKSLFDPSFICPFLIITILLTVILIWNKNRSTTFGILFFLITLIPVYNIIPLGNPFAERYVYLPAVGFAIVAGLAFQSIIRSRIPKFETLNIVLIALLLSIMCIYSVTIIRRNKTWEDNYSLWSGIAKRMPDNARSHYSLGLIYIDKKLFNKAVESFSAALKLKPDYTEAYFGLGLLYTKLGQPDNAIQCYQFALRLKPDYPEAHINLANVYATEGRLDEAINEYKTILKQSPANAHAHNNMGVIYLRQGDTANAVTEFLIAVKLNPDYANAHYNLGIAFYKLDRIDEAVQEYKTALKLDPTLTEANDSLREAYSKKKFE